MQVSERARRAMALADTFVLLLREIARQEEERQNSIVTLHPREFRRIEINEH